MVECRKVSFTAWMSPPPAPSHVGTEQQHRDALVCWDPAKYKRVYAFAVTLVFSRGGVLPPLNC